MAIMNSRARGAGTTPFVGRSEELAVIEQLLGRVVQGGAQAAVIDGEAGIGKTRLLDEAARVANGFGFEVIRGRAEQLEVGRPFGAFADALAVGETSNPLRAGLGELLGRPAPADPGSGVRDDRPVTLYALVEEVLALVERLAARGPLALALEDLQWADDGTLTIVHAIHRRLKDLPIALLLSVRPGDFSPTLNRLLDLMEQEGCEQIALGPLAEDAVAELVESVLGAPPSEAIREQVRAAAGNPLYVVELVGALVEEGAFGGGKADVETRPIALPPSLRLTILRRLSTLAPDALRVLRLAAVLGPSFELSHLKALLGRSTIELLPALDTGLGAGLLMQSGDRLAFRHDLIRTAIYEDLAPAIRAGLHLDAARALATSGATSIDVAEHFTLGASRGDREAVEWILRAAREYLERAPAVTLRLLDRVLVIMEDDDPGRDRILAEKVLALAWSGQGQDDFREAERVARAVLAGAHDPVAGTMIRLALLTSLLVQGRPVEAEIESKTAAASPEVSGRLKAWILAAGAFATILLGELDGAWAAAEESRLEGERIGDEIAQCMARCAQSHVSILQAHPADAVALANEALLLSSEARAQWFHAHWFLGWALLECDRFEEAEQAFQKGRAFSERVRTVWNLGTYAWGVVWLRFSSGEWDDAIAEGETSVTSYREQPTGVAWLHAPLAIIAVQRNEFDRAEDLIADAQTELEERNLGFTRHWVLISRAILAEARGDVRGAQAMLAEAWEVCMTLGMAFLHPRLGPDLVRLSLEVDAARAGTVVSLVEATAERMSSPSAAAAALRSRGLLEGDPELLLAAVAVSKESPRPFERARILEDAAATLARTDRISEAVPLLQESLGFYGRLGAIHPEARVLAALRSLGVRPGRRGSRKRPTSGPEALTDTERKVARLIADGLTYREVGAQLFISPRTVETHVSHALAKLGCRSRRELKHAVQALAPS